MCFEILGSYNHFDSHSPWFCVFKNAELTTQEPDYNLSSSRTQKVNFGHFQVFRTNKGNF